MHLPRSLSKPLTAHKAHKAHKDVPSHEYDVNSVICVVIDY